MRTAGVEVATLTWHHFETYTSHDGDIVDLLRQHRLLARAAQSQESTLVLEGLLFA